MDWNYKITEDLCVSEHMVEAEYHKWTHPYVMQTDHASEAWNRKIQLLGTTKGEKKKKNPFSIKFSLVLYPPYPPNTFTADQVLKGELGKENKLIIDSYLSIFNDI